MLENQNQKSEQKTEPKVEQKAEQKKAPPKVKILSKEEKTKIENVYNSLISLRHRHVREGAKPIGKENEAKLKELEVEVNSFKGRKAKENKTISGGVGAELKTAKGVKCPEHLLNQFIEEFKSYHPKKGKEYVKNLLDKYFE